MRIHLSKLSTAELLALPPVKEEFYDDEDVPGLKVRVRQGNGDRIGRRWYIKYRVAGRELSESLGDVRRLTYKDVVKIARTRTAQAELGQDPRAEEKRARAEAAAAQRTLGTVIPRYLDLKKDRLAPSTYAAATRYLLQYWKPLHSRALNAVKQADVTEVLETVERERGRVAASNARQDLGTFYTWAMRAGLCEANPVALTADPAAGIPSRDRVLTDEEIRHVWAACQDDDFGRIVRLLLLTGCRRDEIGNLKWDEINLDTGMLTIAGLRTKTRRVHELALPPLALGILEAAPHREGRTFVFGVRGDRPFSGWSASKLCLDARITIKAGKPIEAWRLHDLRRTMRSNLGALGVAPHVAELCIGHQQKGVQAIYDRYAYRPEVKAALERWGDRIGAIVKGG